MLDRQERDKRNISSKNFVLEKMERTIGRRIFCNRELHVEVDEFVVNRTQSLKRIPFKRRSWVDDFIKTQI